MNSGVVEKGVLLCVDDEPIVLTALRDQLRRDGDDAVVSIGDTGCGIPEDIRARIFDAFFTTKPAGEGTGLGLDIVRKIIDKHQGRIEVRSEVGVGSTFTVRLPIAGVS